MPLNAQIMLSILAHETSTGDLSKTLRATPASYALTLTDGTGANQAQIVWSFSGAFDGEYFFGGEDFTDFTDSRGNVNFSAIKTIYIKNTGATPFSTMSKIDWETGPNVTPGSGGIEVKPGAVLFMCRSDATGWSTAGGYLGVSSDTNGSCELVLIGEGTIT
jgi:hypothetical protein